MEWVVHKFFLTRSRKEEGVPFVFFHWGVHHRAARKNGFLDGKVSAREIVGVSLCLLASPVLFIYPIIYTGMFIHAMVYLVVHNYAHRNPDWCYKYLRWHL